MVDSVVSFALENLSQLLTREATLLYGVEDKVKSLQHELQIIDTILNPSSKVRKKKRTKEIEQVVLNQIRDVAHEAEDVIDTFVANVAIQKRRPRLWRMLHGVNHAVLLHEVSGKIDNIKATLKDIRDNKINYEEAFFQQESIESGSTSKRGGEDEEEMVQQLHKRRRKVEEDDVVVGFVNESKVIIERLLDEGSRSDVVSIVGMGGLGKTTLARKVYNSNEVKRYFNRYAWFYVSNDCRVKELLLGLLEYLKPYIKQKSVSQKKDKKQKDAEKPEDLISSLSVDELKQIMKDCLKGQRYLVVLDDLWKTQDWDQVQDAFPRDKRGSKILITSRQKEVASHTSPESPYFLQLLNDKESWELFSKRVFRGEECPPDLESLGYQIAKSCHGLPLSIVILAGLLANKEKSHR